LLSILSLSEEEWFVYLFLWDVYRPLLFLTKIKGKILLYLLIKARFEEDIKIILLSENFVW
jgi:sensor domain CHASE-containing protein